MFRSTPRKSWDKMAEKVLSRHRTKVTKTEEHPSEKAFSSELETPLK